MKLWSTDIPNHVNVYQLGIGIVIYIIGIIIIVHKAGNVKVLRRVNTKLTRFVRIWNDYDNALRSSVTKNSIVEFRVGNSDAINWLYTIWGGRLVLNDYWALFAHFNVVKPIDQKTCWFSCSSTIATTQGLVC